MPLPGTSDVVAALALHSAPLPMLADLRRRLAARRAARRLAAITLDAARTRAERGAAFLDALDPAWASRVDVRRLELSDGAACVLGQLHGDYRLGLGRSRVLDLSSAPVASLSPVDLGFQAVGDCGEPAEGLDYTFLTRAWREQVTSRCGVETAARVSRVASPNRTGSELL